jgi:type III restriction enzyme
MRLVVNQQGQRLFEDKLNILTVVANESYERFVEALQAEMIDEFGVEGAAPKPVNAREKRVAKRKPLDALPEEFANLWEKIKPKTRYQVTVNTEKLVGEVVGVLDKIKIDPPRIVASKAEITADAKEDRLDYQHFEQKVVATLPRSVLSRNSRSALTCACS